MKTRIRKLTLVATSVSLLLTLGSQQSVNAQLWFEDFTDGDISDDSGINWSFGPNGYTQRDDGIVLEGNSLEWILAFEEVEKSKEWSIRVEAQLLQDHGYFGPTVAPNNGANGAIWAELNTPRKAGFGLAGSSHATQSDLLEVNPQENAIVQFDTTATHAFVWAWSPDEMPDPFLDGQPSAFTEINTPSGYPGVWLNNSQNGAALLVKNITFSTEHLVIGEVSVDCDLDESSLCDVSDLDLLVVSYDSDAPMFDLNGDGMVDKLDLHTWLGTAGNQNIGRPYLVGDVDLDGSINAFDLNSLALNWQSTTATSYAQGDLNGDGHVNASDLNDLALNWQSTAAAAPVPEPTSSLAAVLVLAWFLRRRLVRRNSIID